MTPLPIRKGKDGYHTFVFASLPLLSFSIPIKARLSMVQHATSVLLMRIWRCVRLPPLKSRRREAIFEDQEPLPLCYVVIVALDFLCNPSLGGLMTTTSYPDRGCVPCVARANTETVASYALVSMDQNTRMQVQRKADIAHMMQVSHRRRNFCVRSIWIFVVITKYSWHSLSRTISLSPTPVM